MTKKRARYLRTLAKQKDIWEKAAKWEGKDPNKDDIELSEWNPYKQDYNNLSIELSKLISTTSF